jgi:predicted RND superfamily exporter protein
MPERITRALIDRLIAWRVPLLALGALLAVACYLPARKLEFDQSLENMFAADDPLLTPYRRMKRVFGGSEIALAAYHDPDVFTEAGIERLRKITDELAGVDGVTAAQSLANTPLGPAIIDQANAVARKLVELFEGYTISADRKTPAIICIVQPPTSAARREIVDRLRAIIEGQDRGMLAGEPVMIADGFRYLEDDGRLLRTLSTALLMLTIVVCFRSVRWVVVPLAVVLLTLWLTEALLVVLDLRLSMVSSMMAAIVTIVGVATVMHIIVGYRDERARGQTSIEAFRGAGVMLAVPIVSACLTDTVGCTSLLLARVGPIQDFGLMNAIGLTLVLLSVVLVVPGLVLLWPRVDPDPHRIWGEGHLDRGLLRSLESAFKRPWVVVLITVVLAAVAVAGSMRLEVETDFTKNFRKSSPLVQSYDFIERELGGAGVWDLIVQAPEKLDAVFLQRVLAVEQRLRDEIAATNEAGGEEPGLTKVFSMADVVQAVSPISLEALARMPEGLVTPTLNTALEAMRARMPDTINALYAKDPESGEHAFRILLRSKERLPSASKQHIIAEVERIARESFAGEGGGQGAEVTGFYVLLTNLIDSLLRDQWITFAAATVGMWLVMSIVFRSMLLGGIALAPNVLPVFLMTGTLGWMGIKLNMGAAVIAAFSMGLSVDSSVHYILDFQRARRGGVGLRDALTRAHESAGRAAVFATLALVVGFSALAVSKFVPTIYFGVLTGLTMLGGLAGNLFVLPALLRIGAK